MGSGSIEGFQIAISYRKGNFEEDVPASCNIPVTDCLHLSAAGAAHCSPAGRAPRTSAFATRGVTIYSAVYRQNLYRTLVIRAAVVVIVCVYCWQCVTVRYTRSVMTECSVNARVAPKRAVRPR